MTPIPICVYTVVIQKLTMQPCSSLRKCFLLRGWVVVACITDHARVCGSMILLTLFTLGLQSVYHEVSEYLGIALWSEKMGV